MGAFSVDKKQDWGINTLGEFLRRDTWSAADACKILSLDNSDGSLSESAKEKCAILWSLWQSKGSFSKACFGYQPVDFIQWALSKDIRPAWLDWAIENKLVLDEPSAPITDVETPEQSPEQRRQRIQAYVNKEHTAGKTKKAAMEELAVKEGCKFDNINRIYYGKK